MRTIHLDDNDCLIIIKTDSNQVEVNVPMKFLEDEIPDNAKLCVALTHLLNDQNETLNALMKNKWNELLEYFKRMKNVKETPGNK